MKRTPSGLKARAPADLSGTLPVVAPGNGALKARATARQVAVAIVLRRKLKTPSTVYGLASDLRSGVNRKARPAS